LSSRDRPLCGYGNARPASTVVGPRTEAAVSGAALRAIGRTLGRRPRMMLPEAVIQRQLARMRRICESFPEVETRSGQHHSFLVRVTIAVLAGGCSSSGHSAPPTTSHVSASTTHASPTTAASTAPCPAATTMPGGASGKEVNPPGDIPDNQAFVAYTPPSGGY